MLYLAPCRHKRVSHLHSPPTRHPTRVPRRHTKHDLAADSLGDRPGHSDLHFIYTDSVKTTLAPHTEKLVMA